MAAATILVLIGSLRIASTYRVFNHTIDEPEHLAAGMEWLDAGKYLYMDEQPPLSRIFGAFLPWVAGEEFHRGPASYSEGYRILGRGEHYDRVLALGRLGMLPFFWMASAVVFLWARRTGGAVAGVMAALLFTTTPPVLAHSGLITTDMALAATVALAAYVSLLWAEAPTRRRTLALGAAVGLAAIAKFSALAFLPAAWAAMYLAGKGAPSPGSERRAAHGRLRELAVALCVAAVIVWAAYRFTFAHVEWLGLRLPAPRFFAGLDAVWKHNQAGHPSYLLGQRSLAGFWYYFPVALAVKTPVAMLLLAAVGVWIAARRRANALALPLAFSLGVLLFAMTSRISIGVRHILPVYVGLSIAGGAVAARALARRTWAAPAVAALLAWHVASGARQHPDYLAYANEAAAGKLENVLADSDLDWGQDMKRLGERLRLAGIEEVSFAPFNRTYAWAGHPFPKLLPVNPDRPSPGWNAVSITPWKLFGFPAWVDRMPPGERVGRSILLWCVPPGSCESTNGRKERKPR